MTKCGECKYFYRRSDSPDGQLGDCKEQSPKAHMHIERNQLGQIVQKVFGYFPPVKHTETCGKYQSKILTGMTVN